MHIGQLNKKVDFYQNIPEAIGAGYGDIYFLFLTTYGYLKKRAARKAFSAGEVMIDEAWELWIRYQPYLENHLRVDLKIVIEGRTFAIESWELKEEKHFWYKFIVNEKK